MKLFWKVLFCFILFSLLPHNVLAKRTIYITLDISGSMNGSKYNLANYGMQVLSVLNNNENVVLIISANPRKLKESSYLNLQKGTSKIGSTNRTEIEDIHSFNQEFSKSESDQEIFIIGDGNWWDNEEILNQFYENVSTGNIRVTFLEMLNNKKEEMMFEKFLIDKKIGKIFKVESTRDIIESINTITEEITGVSAIPSAKLKENKLCLSFTNELGLKNIKFVYQDNAVLSAIPDVLSINVNGQSVKFNNLGNPSNEKLTKSSDMMSSRIYDLTHNIPLGSKIEICFNKNFQKDKFKIYPVTEIEISGLSMKSISGSEITQIDDHTVGVCKNDKHGEVSFQVIQKGTSLPTDILEKVEVFIHSNGKKYKAKLNNGQFSAQIPLTGDTTFYTVESELKGYFKKNSGINKIIKTDKCFEKPSSQKIPPMLFGSIQLSQLIRNGKISGQLVDENSGSSLNPKLFDIELENNYKHLFKNIKIEFKENNTIDLILEPRGYWCDCLMPDQLDINFKATPKSGQLIDGKQYAGIESVLIVKIDKNESWLSRCLWLLISLLASFILIYYLFLLKRKVRFGKGARIEFKAPGAGGTVFNLKYISTDFILRQKGFIAWLNRWLIPFGSEKRQLFFDAISLGLLFTATNSVKRIQFPKASYNENTMSSDNYDPDSKNQFILMDENSPLEVKYNRQPIKYILNYNCPKEANKDIDLYNTVLSILITLLSIYFIACLYFIIKSLL
jgi:hypothetical protein